METNGFKVSVIIPTYGRGKYLVRALEQLFVQSQTADEILVIDQTPRHPPEIKELLERFAKEGKIKLFYQDTPNLPMARNRGIKETKANVLIFIDDDVLINRDFIKNHLINYTNDEIAGVAGQILNSKQPFSMDKLPLKKSSHFLDWLDFPLNFSSRTTTILMVGSNFSIRRSVAVKAKGFDTNFIGSAAGEDNDFSWRVYCSGGKVLYEPLAKVFNLSPAYGGCKSARYNWSLPTVERLQNILYFYLKDLFNKYPFKTTRLILRHLRREVLNKNNIFNSYFLIVALSSFFYALCRAIFLLTRGPRLLDI